MMTLSRRAAAVDLALVLGVALASLRWASPANSPFKNMHGMAAVLALAAFQFTVEGLVPLLLVVIRREKFSDFGLTLGKAGKSISLAIALAALYDLCVSWRAAAWLWVPLRRHTAVRLSLGAGFPWEILGFAVTIAVWGCVEGLFGVFFARRVDQFIGHSGTGWLATGALAFGCYNGLLHLAIGQGMEGFLTNFFSGYAIGAIPAVSRNAVGSALFQSLTNAVGRL